MAKTTAGGEGNGKGGGGLIGLVVVTLLAVGCGAGFGFYLDGKIKSAAVAKASEKAKEPVQEEQVSTVPSTAQLVALAPIVVNLAEPRDAWIRIEASILVDGMSQGADDLAAQLAEDMVAYLRTTPLRQFEGPSGFQHLREDFVDRATIRDRVHIKDVIIHGVVVE